MRECALQIVPAYYVSHESRGLSVHTVFIAITHSSHLTRMSQQACYPLLPSLFFGSFKYSSL